MAGGGFDRRSVLGLAAGAAATAAHAAPAKAPGKTAGKAARTAPGATMAGPGVPVPSKVEQTRTGKVQGLIDGGISHFRGIRYG